MRKDQHLLQDLHSHSFQVGRGIVPPELIDDVLRILHIDLLENGHSAQTLGEWLWAMHWFPHLNYPDEILAPWRRENGGLLVNVDGEPVAVELDPGDAVMLSPALEHSGGVNRTGSPRYGVYLRRLENP